MKRPVPPLAQNLYIYRSDVISATNATLLFIRSARSWKIEPAAVWKQYQKVNYFSVLRAWRDAGSSRGRKLLWKSLGSLVCFYCSSARMCERARVCVWVSERVSSSLSLCILFKVWESRKFLTGTKNNPKVFLVCECEFTCYCCVLLCSWWCRANTHAANLYSALALIWRHFSSREVKCKLTFALFCCRNRFECLPICAVFITWVYITISQTLSWLNFIVLRVIFT